MLLSMKFTHNYNYVFNQSHRWACRMGALSLGTAGGPNQHSEDGAGWFPSLLSDLMTDTFSGKRGSFELAIRCPEPEHPSAC